MRPSGVDSTTGPGSSLPPASPAPDPERADSRRAVVASLLLIGAGAAAYASSLTVPFLFDDSTHILHSSRIERLWPPWSLLGSSFRPILKLTLAINYALGERDPFGYHVVNAGIHILSALTLFGVVRRTVAGAGFGARVLGGATGFGFAVSLLWLVHPLQTQAVTYTIQRGESLASLFYLLTLYAAIRCANDTNTARWGVVAVVVCALGMGTKEIVATAPLVVLLYDRTFVAGSFAAALRQRRWLYLGLASCWGVTVATVGRDLALEHGTKGTLGDDLVSPVRYLLSQPAILLHYLRLAVWPDPLIFDYGWPAVERGTEVVAPAAAILALLGLTGAGLWARRWWGFVLAWFFLILAPTSSFVPLADLAVEHRMYLPLASPVLLAVALVARNLARREVLGGRVAALSLGAVALVLAGLTVSRNREYQDLVVLWSGVAEHRPENHRGFLNLGFALSDRGRGPEARRSFERAIELRPGYVLAHFNLANELLGDDRLDEAIAHYRSALESEPDWVALLGNLGVALRRNGQSREAVLHHVRAVELEPRSVRSRHQLGLALEAAGSAKAAVESYRAAIALDPGHAASHLALAQRLSVLGRGSEAIAHYRAALRRDPGSARATNGLAWILATHPDAAMRRPGEAISLARRAVEATEGRAASALDTLAAAQASAGDFEGAVVTARRALDEASSAADADFALEVAKRLAGYEHRRIYVDGG